MSGRASDILNPALEDGTEAMNSEIALVVIVVLLWGPTAAWLIYRSTRSQPESPSFKAADMDRQPAGLNVIASTLLEGGYWVCRSCRSVNRPDTVRCYNCRAESGATPIPQPVGDAERPMVAVMTPSTQAPAADSAQRGAALVNSIAPAASAEATAIGAVNARRRAEPARTATAAVERSTDGSAHGHPVLRAGASGVESTSAGTDRGAVALPVPSLADNASTRPTHPRPAPGADAGRTLSPATASPDRVGMPPAAAWLPDDLASARSSRRNPTALWAAPSELNGRGRPDAQARVAPLRADAAPRQPSEGPSVCPYLGSKDDQFTRFDFPYAANACYVGVKAGGRGEGGQLGKLVQRLTAKGPQPIGPDHQAALCLTPDHVACLRYVQFTQSSPTTGVMPAPTLAVTPGPSVSAAAPAAPHIQAAPATMSAAPHPPASSLAAQGTHRPPTTPVPDVPQTRTRRPTPSRSAGPTTLTYPPTPAAAPKATAAPISVPESDVPPSREPVRRPAASMEQTPESAAAGEGGRVSSSKGNSRGGGRFRGLRRHRQEGDASVSASPHPKACGDAEVAAWPGYGGPGVGARS